MTPIHNTMTAAAMLPAAFAAEGWARAASAMSRQATVWLGGGRSAPSAPAAGRVAPDMPPEAETLGTGRDGPAGTPAARPDPSKAGLRPMAGSMTAVSTVAAPPRSPLPGDAPDGAAADPVAEAVADATGSAPKGLDEMVPTGDRPVD